MMERTNRNLWIGIGLVALVALVALPAWSGGMMVGRGFAGPFGYHPFFAGPWLLGFWGIGLLVRLLFFGAIALLLVRLFRGFSGRSYRHYYDGVGPADLPPSEILRRRYAAGEISREQYEEMKRTLEPGG
jgi:putative membrane protein